MKISVRFLHDHDDFIEPASSLSRFSVPLLPRPLHDGQKHLLERVAVVNHPGSIRFRRTDPLRCPVRAASISIARTPEMDELPGATMDCAELKRILEWSGVGSVHAAENDVVDANVVEGVLRSRPNVLLISAHFAANDADASQSAFLMADGSHYTLAQLAQNDLSSIQLALLMGCQTQAVSDVEGALGISSIDGLLLRMNVGSVLVSAWKIDDRVAHQVLAHFLNAVFHKRLDLAQALRAAVLAVSCDADTGKRLHPTIWGGYGLYGGWNGLHETTF